MKRYLYILICLFDVSFCYNFIDNYGKYIKKHVGNRRGSHRDRNSENHVQLDLTEFMRKEKNEADFDIGNEQSNYNYMGFDDDNIRKTDVNDYLNVKDNDNDLNNNLKDLLSMDERNSRNEVTQNLVDDQNEMLVDAHNPEKKCALKFMKIPFFSRSNSTTKPKKAKKPKEINKDFPKSSTIKDINVSRTSAKRHDKNNIDNKYEKRYSNKLLPFGNKKQKVIHNSRQYFESKANVENTENPNQKLFKTTLKMRKDESSFDYNGFIFDDFQQEQGTNENHDRKKREDAEANEKRLKELDEIQRKVDNVEIHMPVIKKT